MHGQGHSAVPFVCLQLCSFCPQSILIFKQLKRQTETLLLADILFISPLLKFTLGSSFTHTEATHTAHRYNMLLGLDHRFQAQIITGVKRVMSNE